MFSGEMSGIVRISQSGELIFDTAVCSVQLSRQSPLQTEEKKAFKDDMTSGFSVSMPASKFPGEMIPAPP